MDLKRPPISAKTGDQICQIRSLSRAEIWKIPGPEPTRIQRLNFSPKLATIAARSALVRNQDAYYFFLLGGQLNAIRNQDSGMSLCKMFGLRSNRRVFIQIASICALFCISTVTVYCGPQHKTTTCGFMQLPDGTVRYQNVINISASADHAVYAKAVEAENLAKVFQSALVSRFSGSIKAVHVHFGARYTPCDTDGTVWFLIGGHLRGFETQLANFEGFVRPSKCFFLIFYVREQLDHTTSAWWHGDDFSLPESVKDVKASDTLRALFTNVGWLRHANHAYAVVTQHAEVRERDDVITGPWLLHRLSAQYHNISYSKKDIFIRTRPDLLYSHTLDYTRLRNLAVRYAKSEKLGNPDSSDKYNSGFGFLIKHETNAFAYWDPSDIFWMGNAAYFKTIFGHSVSSDDPLLFLKCDSFHHVNSTKGCFSPYLTNKWMPGSEYDSHQTYEKLLISRPNRLSCATFFVRGEFKIHIRRLHDGSYRAAINRPSNTGSIKLNSTKLSTIDVTKKTVSVVGRANFHCVEQKACTHGKHQHLYVKKCYSREHQDGICRGLKSEFFLYMRDVEDAFSHYHAISKAF